MLRRTGDDPRPPAGQPWLPTADMQDILQVAVRHHQSGQLREAAQAYQSILAKNPNHPDALHLLGVVAHQFGQHRQATELIGRAIRVRPDVPSFYANLGEAWRAMGEFDRAAEISAAARLHP